MITKCDIQQLLEEARDHLAAEIDRGDDGFVIRAHYDEHDKTYSIYLTDSERMIEEARRKSREEADDLIYGGTHILSSEVGEERSIVTVKPSSRIFDSYWVATLLVVPGCAYVVGWASDTSYAQLLHDAVVEAAKKGVR